MVEPLTEDDVWRPVVRSSKIINKRKLPILQSLPHHDYHDTKDVILPNTNLFLEKDFALDDTEHTSWKGSKVAVVLPPKLVCQTTALMHVNERYQLRMFGDEEKNK